MEKYKDEIDKMGLLNCSKVYIDKCEYGYGCFAKEDIKNDEVIETGLMMRMNNVDGNENEHLFTWSDDKKIWACGSGCLPFYNHSNNQNIKKIGDLKNDKMIVVSLKDIKKGEELRSRYMSAKWRKCFKNLND